MQHTAMPEWLERKDRPNGAWVVTEGQPVRGDAWTNNTERVMRVPVGADAASRVIRAHEMMHARVSPMLMDAHITYKVSDGAIRSAEEFRVNMLCNIAGFNMDDLCDGSEKMSGERQAQSKNWNGIILDIAAQAGGKALKDYFKGMKSVDSDLHDSAKAVDKAIMDFFNRFVTSNVPRTDGRRGRRKVNDRDKQRAARIMGSTEQTESGYPAGFVKFTIPLARMLDGMMVHETGVPNGDSGMGENENENLPTPEEIRDVAAAGTAGHFAPLMLDHDVVLSRRVDGRLGRRKVATNMGRNPRRIGRMLTDPEHRVFDRKVKGKGGMVVIDQSGSMNLTDEQLWEIVNAAPGCTIIGYSHRSRGGVPNVWVLADRGKVCESIPRAGYGNGVDGPAIRFAATKRRSGEPFIWVCDGYVTAFDDSFHESLAEKCADLVIKHGIHMVPDVGGAVKALSKAVRNNLPTTATGPIRDSKTFKEFLRSGREV